MAYFKIVVIFFMLYCVLIFVRCLEKLTAVEHDDLAITESAIRQTFNNLFADLGVRDDGHKPKLKDFTVIHNFFVLITLKDFNNLKRILQLTQVNDVDNNTLHFIEAINEGDNSIDSNDVLNVNSLIENFIDKLRDLKKTYTFNRNLANYSISDKILTHLNRSAETLPHISCNLVKTEESDNVSNSEEIWKPAEKSGRRIFEGHRTRIKHYPFMASVHFFQRFQCGGSIIHKDLVITAASCLQLAWNNRFFRENPSFLSVQIGSEYYEAGGEEISISEVYFHPEYTPRNLRNNLALMRLSKHIEFTKSHKKVKRIQYDTSPFPLPINTDRIIVVGWGAIDSSNIIYDPWINKLSFSELPFYPLPDCQEVYSKEFVTLKHFCSGYFSKGSGACQRDIGGPGISSGVLVGVISFGPPTCGTPDAPTVFTKVGFYSDWIEEIIEMDVPSILRSTTLRRPKPTLETTTKATTTFKIEPLTYKQKEHPYESKIDLPQDTLRILGDDNLFKDFLSTMFGSENIDNVDIFEHERNDMTGKKTKKYIARTLKGESSTSTSRPPPTKSGYSRFEIKDPPSDPFSTTANDKDGEQNAIKTKGVGILIKPKSAVVKSPQYSIKDIVELPEANTENVGVQNLKAKLPTSFQQQENYIIKVSPAKLQKTLNFRATRPTSVPLLYDSEIDIKDLTEIQPKKYAKTHSKKSLTTINSNIPSLYEYYYEYEDANMTVSYTSTDKAIQRKTTATELSAYKENLYTDEIYSYEYETEHETPEINNEHLKKPKNRVSESIDENFKTIETESTTSGTIGEKDLDDLDVEELIKGIQMFEENSELKNVDLKIDGNRHITAPKSKSTTKLFSRPDYEEEYVYENDDKLPKIELVDDHAESDNKNQNEDSTIEKEIHTLLDDLDIHKFLESAEPTNVVIESNKTKTKRRRKRMKLRNVGKRRKPKPRQP